MVHNLISRVVHDPIDKSREVFIWVKQLNKKEDDYILCFSGYSGK